jgi:hypothetical protein
LGTLVLPQFTSERLALSPNRGSEANLVSEYHAQRLHLIAPNVSDGPVSVELVDGNGTQLWTARTLAANHRVDVRVPALSISGTHFLRLSKSDDSTANLSRCKTAPGSEIGLQSRRKAHRVRRLGTAFALFLSAS